MVNLLCFFPVWLFITLSWKPIGRIINLRISSKNIFLEWAPDRSLSVKIGDFSVSKHIPKNSSTILHTNVGTFSYTAPEIFSSWNDSDEYFKEVDCWSVGCIMYTLLTGTELFKTVGDVIKYQLTHVPLPSTLLRSTGCTELGETFIDALIDPVPSQRLPASTALLHGWCNLPLPIGSLSAKLTSKLLVTYRNGQPNLESNVPINPGSVDIQADVPHHGPLPDS